MNPLAVCPDAQSLTRMLQGELALAEVDSLAHHVETCQACLATLQSMSQSDTLVDLIRRQAREQKDRPDLTAMIERLQSLSDYGTVPPSHEGTPTPNMQPPRPETIPLAPPQRPDEIGRLGSYRILGKIVEGGMGVLFRAEDSALHRHVVLKVMKPSVAASAASRERFLREGRLAAALEHENVVPVYQVGEAQGVPYLVMPLLKGEALDARLRREKHMPIAEVLRIGREIAEGLHAAHTRGLLHRDIKPGNLWLTERTGRVKILDFGLARPEIDPVQLTAEGMLLGTPAYMAPEQAAGKPVGTRADLFSLGCVLYELCTGTRAFQGADVMATLAALASHNPQPPAEINPETPAELSRLIMQLLAKQPEGRPGNARQVLEALSNIEPTSQATVAVATPATLAAKTRSPRRSRAPLVALAVALLALLAVGFFFGGTIIRIASNKGELVIESDDPNIEIWVTKDGAVIHDKLKDRRLELVAGEYELQVKEAGEGLQFTTKKFTVTRGGKTTLVASLEKKPDPRPEPGPDMRDIATGLPLTSHTLVRAPGKLPGVQSWTIETRGIRVGGNSIAYSPDGRWLAAGASDGAIRLWDAQSGKLVKIFVGHTGYIRSLTWSPDAKHLASCDPPSGSVKVWEIETGKVNTYGPFRETNTVAWSPDGSCLAIGQGGEFAVVVDAQTGSVKKSLPGHTHAAQFVTWIPKRNLLATIDNSWTLRLWDPVSGELKKILKNEKGSARVGSPSPDGKLLASYEWEGKISIWDIDSAKIILSIPIDRYHEHSTKTISWSPDGNTLATCGWGTVRLWDAKTGRQMRAFSAGQEEENQIDWSPDGKKIAIVTLTGTVREWDAELGQPIRSHGGAHTDGVWSVDVAPDNRTVALGTSPRSYRLILWDGTTRMVKDKVNATRGLKFSPDGKLLAVSGSQIVYWYDVASTGQLTTHPAIWDIPKVAWFPDGKSTAVTIPEGFLLIDGERGQRSRRVKSGSTSSPGGISVSPDGRRLAMGMISGPDAGSLFIHDTKDGKLLHKLTGAGWVVSIAWSPDGKRLVTCAEGVGVCIFDVEQEKKVCHWARHPVRPSNVVWSADGKTITSVSEDNLICQWDPESGELKETIQGSKAALAPGFCTLSRDGSRGATPHNNTLQLWDTSTGNLLALLVLLRDEKLLSLSAEGHYAGPKDIDKELLYILQTDKGQETLTPGEFSRRFGWKNDPSRVRLPK